MDNKFQNSWKIKTVPVSTINDDKLSHDVISELLDEKLMAYLKKIIFLAVYV